MTNSEILKNRNIKKQTVKELCERFNKTNVDERRKVIVGEIMKPYYIPYENKIAICKKIAEVSCYETVERDGLKVKKLHVDSTSKYMLFCLNLVKCYTNIDINFKNALEEFNMLNEYGVLDEIYAQIPDKESKEFHMVMDMVENDIFQNEYENHAFISNQVERFADLFGHILTPALDKLLEAVVNATMDNEDSEDSNSNINKVENSSENNELMNGIVNGLFSLIK